MLPSMETISYRSTRSDRVVGVETAIAEGLSPDGGLYVPTFLPALPDRAFDPAPLSYAELALLVLRPFFPGWEDGSLERILRNAYANADDPKFFRPEIAPLRAMGDGTALLELFHGRTAAFKDLALSVMGGLLRESLDRLGVRDEVLVLAATSGDTGSAALEGFSSVPGVKTAVLYPDSGTSEIQRLQMTCVPRERRYVAALRGDFDDAQRAVKSVFAATARGAGALAGVRLSSANSINMGRLLPQIVYYVKAWRDLAFGEGAPGAGTRVRPDVAVPTGNFGDILAAWYAKRMGLPLGTLICASNANRVLADFFATGQYDRRRTLVKTESPSMDILVSSNLERLLFEVCGRDSGRISSLMGDLANKGQFALTNAERAGLGDFRAGWADDAAGAREAGRVWKERGVLVDPHTAVALQVSRRLRSTGGAAGEAGAPLVVVSTASPYKFPRACARALDMEIPEGADDFAVADLLARRTGEPMPSPLAALAGSRPNHRDVLDRDQVESALAAFAKARA